MKTAMKRLFSLLLALTMVLSMVPTAALAAEIEETEPPLVTEPAETTAPPEATEPPATETETEAPTTDATEAEVIETEAPVTDPVETEAPATDPVETESVETEPAETEAPATDPVETESVETEPAETEAPVVEVEQMTANAPVTYVVANRIERDILLPRVDMNLDQLPGDENRFIDTEDALIDDGIKCIRNYIGKTAPSGGYVDEVPGDYKGFDGQWLAAVLEFEGVAENGVLTIFDENTTVVINGTQCPTELLDEGTRIRATYVYQLQTIEVYNIRLNIPAPVAGEEAVFEAEYASPTGDRYEIGAGEGISATNGIRWIVGDSQKALKPGDKFESGHYYKALIYIKSGIGCRFAANVDATVSGAVDVYVSSYYSTETYDQYDPDVYRVVVAEFNLEGEYDIYVENGFAYNAEGDVITSAKPGDIVTLVAGEPPVSDMEGYENMSFEAWEVITNHEPYIFADGDDYKSTTTFVMPEGDVHIQCCFWYTDVEEVNLTLGGYGIGSYVEALTVTEDADGAELGYNREYYANYALHEGENHDINNTMLPAGTQIAAGKEYWLKVTLEAVPGYSLDLLALEYPENIKLNGTPAEEVYLNDNGSLDAAFLLPAAETAEAHTITVLNGYAEVGPGAATSATAGSKVYLYGIVPDDKAENHGFSHWEVVKGNVVLDSDEAYSSFTMPDEDVELKAVYLPYVFDVYLTITEPAGGQKPDFAPQTVTEGITIGEVRWSEIAATHEVSLGKDDTFGYNTGYRVEIDVYLDDAHIFSESPYGYINEEFADAYPDGKCLTLGYYFEVPAQQFTITVNGGKATTANGRTITAAAEGDRVFIKAVAPEGYIFDHWEVVKGDVQILWPEAYTNDFFMPAEDVEVKAVFTNLKDIPIMIVDRKGGDLNPSYDYSVNNRIDMLVRKGQSSYYDQEGDVTWTTSSDAIATVERAAKNYWELVFHKPGTVTVTATDAYGCEDSIKITGYYVDTAKKFTVTSDVPSIGLQVGERARMEIFGDNKENELSPINFEYTVSKEGIVEVRDGWISGIAPGTATITAKLMNDPADRKVTLKVKVIEPQIENICVSYTCVNKVEEETVWLDESTSYTVLYVNAEDFAAAPGSITLAPKVKNSQGSELKLTKSLLKWKSSNTKAAKVTANADGTATVTIPKKASGMARITLTANDKAKTEQIFVLHIRDYTPKLAETKFTLDWWKQPENSYVPLNLTESYGNTIMGVTVTEYNRVTKLYDVSSPNFQVRQEEDGSFSIGLLKNPAQSKGTVKASLNVTCADKETYKYLISITVQNKQPKFTLVQFNPLNYFYNDCSAQLGSTFTLGGDTPLLEKLELSENNQNKDITVVNGNTLVLTEECINDWGRALGYKVDPNIVLKVKLFGYKPFDMNFKVKTERKGPTLVTDPAVLMITHAHQNTTLKFKVLDQATGENLSGYFVYDAALGVTVEKSDNGTPFDPSDDYLTGKVAIEDAGFGWYWTLIGFRKDNWMRRHDLECNVKYVKELPKVSLSEKALNLNSTFTQRTSVAQVSISDSSLDLSDLKLNFACTDEGGSAAFEQAQKISLTYQPGSGVKAAFKYQNDLPTAGSYTFAAIPEVNGVPLPKVTVTVNVQADNSKVTITGGTAKLNKYLAGREIASVSCIVSNDLQLLGFKENGNEFVDISYSNGQIHAKLKRSDAAAKYTFELTPKVKDPASGQIVYLAKKVKLSVQTYTSDKIGIQMSYTGKLNTLNPEKVVTAFVSKVSNAAAGHQILKSMTGADADLFTYREDAQGQITLRLKQGYTYATKKSYEVKFVYDVFGEIVTSNPVKIKITQDTYKPVITPASALYSLSYRGSTAKVLTFKVNLLGAGHAKLDANSIQVNTATPLALRRAMGAAPVVKVSEDGRSALILVSFKHSSHLDSGKSYKLVLDVKPVGSASDVTAQKVTATINVK